MSLSAGTQLGPYEILSHLGAGGMGEVYKAHDSRLGREVAIKVLPQRFAADGDALNRFKREAKALAALSHPSILTIHDYQEDPAKDISFAVMELLEGETLRARIAQSALTWEGAVKVGVQIADGLAAAHSRGVIHRDLKPENIFITNDGRIKILDFGLARMEKNIWTRENSHLPTLAAETREGTIMGTVGYMSPEQVRGGAVDQRTDIFSFGCVLYEMVTGTGPFNRDTPPETMTAILKDDPPDPAKTGKLIPPQLDHIVMRCLRKNSEERFQSAHDLSFALKEVISGTGPQFNPLTYSRRYLRGMMLPLILLAALIIGSITFFFMPQMPFGGSDSRIPIAVADFVNETGEKELDGLSGMLITSLEHSRKLSVMTRSRMFDVVRQMGNSDVERIDENLGKEITKRANAHALVVASIRKFGKLYTIDLKVLDPFKNEYLFTAREEGEGKESIPAMIDNLSEQTRIGLKEKEELIRAHKHSIAEETTTNLEAYQHYFSGDQHLNRLEFGKAEKEFEQAIKLDPKFTLAYYRLAYAISWADEERAKQPIGMALQLIQQAPEKEQYLIRALNAQINNHIEEAISISETLLKLYPDEKEALFTIGDLKFHSGNDQEAEKYLLKTLEIDPVFQRALEHLCMVYRSMGNIEKFEEYARKFVAAVPSETSYDLLAQSFTMRGDFGEATRIYQNGLELFGESGRMYNGLNSIMMFKGEFDQAESVLMNFLKQDIKQSDEIAVHQALAHIYLIQGRYREAMAQYGILEESLKTLEYKNQLSNHYFDRAVVAEFIQHDPSAARGFLQKGLDLGPTEHVVYFRGLESMLLLKEYGRARDLMYDASKPLGLYPNRDVVLRAYSAVSNGRLEEALPLLRMLTSQNRDILVRLYEYGIVAFNARDYDAAIEAFSRFDQTYINSGFNRSVLLPRAYMFLGEAYEKKGDRAKAAAAYGKLLNLWKKADTDSPDLVEARNRLQRVKG